MKIEKIQGKIKKIFGRMRKEILSHQLIYLLLFLILLTSAFFRLFRLHLLLGFWFDQGRDALVVWDLLHYKKFFLIGPVTGIEGIFLGPFYYYLLAPFYWLGKGSPIFAAAGLCWLSVGSVFLIYYLANKIYGYNVALLAAFLYGFSYYQITFSRWLANPNPLPFFTLLVLIFLYKFIQGHNSKFLILASFFIGLCLQLEAAAATFFLPATLIFIFWQKKNVKIKNLILSFLALFITLLPQIYFNYRHQGILLTAFNRFLISERSFNISLGSGFAWLSILKLRLLLYYDVFFGKFFPGSNYLPLTALALFSATFVWFWKKILTLGGKFLLLWLIVPLIGYYFYRGNHGYIWDYYFAGVLPAFIILFSAGLVFLMEKKIYGKVILGLFLIIFLSSNIRFLSNFHRLENIITIGEQTKIIDWIYKDADKTDFNIDVYVPPQIFHSYTYLFRWYGRSKYGREPETKLVSNLYTLYEPDPEHPFLLDAWLKRQDGIGKIIKSYSWGDIRVERRERINKFDSSEFNSSEEKLYE